MMGSQHVLTHVRGPVGVVVAMINESECQPSSAVFDTALGAARTASTTSRSSGELRFPPGSGLPDERHRLGTGGHWRRHSRTLWVQCVYTALVAAEPPTSAPGPQTQAAGTCLGRHETSPRLVLILFIAVATVSLFAAALGGWWTFISRVAGVYVSATEEASYMRVSSAPDVLEPALHLPGDESQPSNV